MDYRVLGRVGAAGALLAASLVPSVAAAHPGHEYDTSPGGVPLHRMSDVRCEDDMAGDLFPCHKTDLSAFVPITEFDTDWINDIWGWTDPQTGREYALLKVRNGLAFIDVTDEFDPVYLGKLSQPTASTWGDVKVYKNHAYVVSEAAGHGMQVFDLTRLRGVTEPRTWTQDAHWDGVSNSHNIAINEESGFAYIIGSTRQPIACDNGRGGPVMVDIRDPKSPRLAGCFAEDGYTHDIQCVNYRGTDRDHAGREVCFASNEDTVTIVDVTDKAAPAMLSRTGYDGAGYTHQGWLTEDHRFFLFNDELDELRGNVDGTTTRILDVADLDAPVLSGSYTAPVNSIDHNMYVKDALVYESNYTNGLRIFDTYKLEEGRLKEAGYFDTFPADDDTKFAGTWSNYPYFDSGVVIVSGIREGLFVMRPRVKSSDPGYTY
ncbi:MAG: choice-of-anchor B family protein [Micromonosporaceae bacterium]|nr:choice-of-anchor B family protein [Micromonosporaceae bacterium]